MHAARGIHRLRDRHLAGLRDSPGAPITRLQQELEAAVQGFHGGVGVYVHHFRTGVTAAIAADDTFPTASMIKVPIMVGVFDAISRAASASPTRRPSRGPAPSIPRTTSPPASATPRALRWAGSSR